MPCRPLPLCVHHAHLLQRDAVVGRQVGTRAGHQQCSLVLELDRVPPSTRVEGGPLLFQYTALSCVTNSRRQPAVHVATATAALCKLERCKLGLRRGAIVEKLQQCKRQHQTQKDKHESGPTTPKGGTLTGATTTRTQRTYAASDLLCNRCRTRSCCNTLVVAEGAWFAHIAPCIMHNAPFTSQAHRYLV